MNISINSKNRTVNCINITYSDVTCDPEKIKIIVVEVLNIS